MGPIVRREADIPGVTLLVQGPGIQPVCCCRIRHSPGFSQHGNTLFTIPVRKRNAAAVYRAEGDYLPAGKQAIDEILRDHRTDEIHPIDTDLLYLLRTEMQGSKPLDIISGYHLPATNAALCKRRYARTVPVLQSAATTWRGGQSIYACLAVI
jgi:hypothetical protein